MQTEGPGIWREKVSIDMEMPFSCVTEEFVSELELLEPFGKGNTKPVFAARDISLLEGRILGKNHNVVKLRVRDREHTSIDAMFFVDTITTLISALACFLAIRKSFWIIWKKSSEQVQRRGFFRAGRRVWSYL